MSEAKQSDQSLIEVYTLLVLTSLRPTQPQSSASSQRQQVGNSPNKLEQRLVADSDLICSSRRVALHQCVFCSHPLSLSYIMVPSILFPCEQPATRKKKRVRNAQGSQFNKCSSLPTRRTSLPTRHKNGTYQSKSSPASTDLTKDTSNKQCAVNVKHLSSSWVTLPLFKRIISSLRPQHDHQAF